MPGAERRFAGDLHWAGLVWFYEYSTGRRPGAGGEPPDGVDPLVARMLEDGGRKRRKAPEAAVASRPNGKAGPPSLRQGAGAPTDRIE